MTLVVSVRAQDLSTEVYASEDELYEALLNSEINFHQYEVLRDAILDGVGQNESHLLDEIPNLSHFQVMERPLSTGLQKEQRLPFVLEPNLGRQSFGELRYRYYQSLDQDSPSRYRGSARVSRGRISAYGTLHREQGGDERVINRYLGYGNPTGTIREIRVGNFTRRLGMGTAFGHRGKLLNFSGRIGHESFLFPDFGGYNGVYSEINMGRTEMQLLASLNRDTDHSLTTAAAMLTHRIGPLNSGLIVGLNNLRDRRTDASLNDVKIALPLRYRYKGGYTAMETCVQLGYNRGWSGVQVEGRHRLKAAEVKYAGWSYADRYLDLSGGSKTGRSRRRRYVEDVDFELSDKRSGHTGGMVKTIVLVTERMHLVNSMVFSGQHRDSADFQLLSGLLVQHDERMSYRLDYLVKSRRRTVASTRTGITSRRTRFEIRFSAGKTTLRSYIAHNTSSDRADYVSLFVRLDYQSPELGRLQVWSNLARLDVRKRMVDYWYVFVRNEQPLVEDVLVAVKMSRRYSRDASAKHLTQLSVEVKAIW